jgi:hypothetical protein
MVNRIAGILYLGILALTSCSPTDRRIEKERPVMDGDPFDDDFDDYDPSRDELGEVFDNPGRFEEADRILTSDPLQRRARAAIKAPKNKISYPIEPREGPWSGNGQLGYTTKFKPNVDNRQTILKLDEWGMPQVWTVALGIKDNRDDIAAGSMAVQAVVSFGSGGVTQEVLLDWKQGAVFSVPMNAINVQAQYVLSSGAGDIDIELSVNLSKGTHSGITSPTFTTNLLLTGGLGNIGLREIPKFATHATLYRPSILSDDPYVTNSFYDFHGIGGSADTIATVEGPNVLSYGALGIPIPNGSKYMRAGGTVRRTVTVVFTLGGL